MKTITFIFFVMAFLFGACTKSDRKVSESDSFVVEDLTIENADTIAHAITKEEPQVFLPARFTNVSSLKEYLRSCPDSAKYSEGLIGRMAEYSLDYANRLLHNQYNRFIVVDKSRMKVVLFDKFGREEKTYGMACAKNYGSKHKKADSRTPEGFFAAEGIYDSTDWLFTDDDGVTSKKKGQFGPRFIRLKGGAYTSQIGIHGTVAPWSIGARASHGCIRVTNENIMELIELVEIGMPIIVIPGRKDMIVNIEEGYDIPWIPTTKNASEPKIPKNITKKEPEQEENIQKDTVAVEKPVEKPDVDSPVEIEGTPSVSPEPDVTAPFEPKAE